MAVLTHTPRTRATKAPRSSRYGGRKSVRLEQPPHACRASALQITEETLASIRATIGSRPAEYGGMLGGSRTDGIIRHFYFDDTAHRTGATYSPDHVTVNRILRERWNPAGIELLGFVHSHPGLRTPSSGDLVYARSILAALPSLRSLSLPIVMSVPDTGRFEMIAYRIVRNGDDVRCEAPNLTILHTDTTETFTRVTDAYDVARLAASRIVAVGVGGAAAFLEEMARAGVGEFVLIDRDVVSETNLATQQTYRKDIGRHKVTCIAERIRDINPRAVVVTCAEALDDDFDDAHFARLASEPLGDRLDVPTVTLLCGFTDDFAAQARVNRLALQFGLPSLCAQVYREGRGAEVSFTYPGVTPACHRCILSARYAAYARGYANDVTANGTPIFATTRLNALKGFVALGILHHGMESLADGADQSGIPCEKSSYRRWGRMLERLGNRNMVQIRMDPDFGETIGLTVFDRVYGGGDQRRIFFDESVWLPQEAESPATGHPHCPDCGGTGDLRDAIGTFTDTRSMRPGGV